MNGHIRLLIAATIGGAIAVLLPREGVLASTQELIGFLALIMAGLLPAMILTATILKGEGISAQRVDDYGSALEIQLRFWGVLFFFAGLSAIGLVGAKIFSQTGVHVFLGWKERGLTERDIVEISLAIFGVGIGVVMQRTYPAYAGLKSLLQLNVSLARAAAVLTDQKLAKALEQDAANSRAPAAYSRFDDPDKPVPH